MQGPQARHLFNFCAAPDLPMLHVEVREPLNRLCCCNLRDAPLIDDDQFVYCGQPIKVGGSILLWGRRKSKFPFQGIVGPDWPIVVIVYVLIVVIDAIVLWVISPLGWVPVCIGAITCALLIWFYSAVACSDPGIIYKNDYSAQIDMSPLSADVESNSSDSNSGMTAGVRRPHPRDRNQLLAVPETIECGQCDLQRPMTAHHCIHCKACIDELDHHCPWCGKCIGEKNLFSFHAFVNLVTFQCYYLMGAFIYYMVFYVGANIPHGEKFH